MAKDGRDKVHKRPCPGGLHFPLAALESREHGVWLAARAPLVGRRHHRQIFPNDGCRHQRGYFRVVVGRRHLDHGRLGEGVRGSAQADDQEDCRAQGDRKAEQLAGVSAEQTDQGATCAEHTNAKAKE
jgi:hypothetical protein